MQPLLLDTCALIFITQQARLAAAAVAALRAATDVAVYILNRKRDELADQHEHEQRRHAAERRHPRRRGRQLRGGLAHARGVDQENRCAPIQARRSAISSMQTWCAIG